MVIQTNETEKNMQGSAHLGVFGVNGPHVKETDRKTIENCNLGREFESRNVLENDIDIKTCSTHENAANCQVKVVKKARAEYCTRHTVPCSNLGNEAFTSSKLLNKLANVSSLTFGAADMVSSRLDRNSRSSWTISANATRCADG